MPPFGTPWKEDLKKRGLADSEKKEFTDSRFCAIGANGEEISFIPDISDCQMMFLANNISRMKTTTKLGTRIVVYPSQSKAHIVTWINKTKVSRQNVAKIKERELLGI